MLATLGVKRNYNERVLVGNWVEDRERRSHNRTLDRFNTRSTYSDDFLPKITEFDHSARDVAEAARQGNVKEDAKLRSTVTLAHSLWGFIFEVNIFTRKKTPIGVKLVINCFSIQFFTISVLMATSLFLFFYVIVLGTDFSEDTGREPKLTGPKLADSEVGDSSAVPVIPLIPI